MIRQKSNIPQAISLFCAIEQHSNKNETCIKISRVLIMMISIYYFTMIFSAIKLEWKNRMKNEGKQKFFLLSLIRNCTYFGITTERVNGERQAVLYNVNSDS